MDYSNVALWSVFLNFVGICLWGITILYFIKNTSKSSQAILMKNTNNKRKPFEDEMLAQMAKQEVKRSAKRISGAFLTRRQMPSGLAEKPVLQKSKNLLLGAISGEGNNSSLQQSTKRSNLKFENDKVYKEILRLADSGTKSKKISELIKIPKGEIELIIKLRKNKHYKIGRPSLGSNGTVS